MSDVADRTPAQVMFGIVLLFVYLAMAIAVTWLGYWYRQAFLFGSPVLASLVAARTREYWPVVDPKLSIFYVWPAMLIVWSLFAMPFAFFTPDPIVDWLPWIGAGVGVAVITTTVLVLMWRKHIDRKWAVVATFWVVLAFSTWSLDTLNVLLPQPSAQSEQVTVLSDSPGGYRQGGPRVRIGPAGPYRSDSTHAVTWDILGVAGRNEPLCLFTSRGGLGWRWVQLDRCALGNGG